MWMKGLEKETKYEFFDDFVDYPGFSGNNPTVDSRIRRICNFNYHLIHHFSIIFWIIKMSYDIDLVHPVSGEVLLLDSPHQMRGGTYAVGGSNECSLNVTYNYAPHFHWIDEEKGIRSIYGLTGAESIPILSNAIDQLGDDVSENYWACTQGNAKAALIQLRALAQMRPDGIWKGD